VEGGQPEENTKGGQQGCLQDPPPRGSHAGHCGALGNVTANNMFSFSMAFNKTCWSLLMHVNHVT
jgi:hypothetical protein